MKDLETIIGLEIHVQLKTRTKMFCGCSNAGENLPPNTAICEVCLGHPGVLPVPNKTAIEMAIKSALALNCTINNNSHFDRKNYFYPDLPKGYQISQFAMPIGINGELKLKTQNSKLKTKENNLFRKIRITRLHLEEDAAKNIHKTNKILIDYNRGGTPLMEIVTEPDFKSPAEAKIFLQELKLIMKYLEVSDADMEKGHLRVDANISLRPSELSVNQANNLRITKLKDSQTISKRSQNIRVLHPKTEIKNLNSFKAVERALEYEIIRQRKLWEAGIPPDKQSTRGWDENKQVTMEQRYKEGSEDYRYFPEPDIPNLRFGTQKYRNTETQKQSLLLSSRAKRSEVEESHNTKHSETFRQAPNDILSNFNINEIKSELPELPIEKRKRFISEYEIKGEDARILTDDKDLADYFEKVVSELRAWMESVEEEGTSDEIWQRNKKKLMKLVSSWLINKLGGLISHSYQREGKELLKNINITPENFAEFITLIYQNKVSSVNAQKVLSKMLETGADPSHIMEDEALEQMSNIEELESVIDEVIKSNTEEVKRYNAGKKELLQFFLGKIMFKTQGKANPQVAKKLLKQELSK